MKLMSSLSLLPLGFATQATETIPYMLQSAAETLLNHYVDASFTYELLKHGCWCAKLNKNSNLAVLGGNNPVDELDQLCADWAITRRCGRNPSENCEFFGKTDNYLVSSGDIGYSTAGLPRGGVDSGATDGVIFDPVWAKTLKSGQNHPQSTKISGLSHNKGQGCWWFPEPQHEKQRFEICHPDTTTPICGLKHQSVMW